MSDDLTAYRQSILDKHSTYFDKHHEIARTLEKAVMEPRAFPSHVHLVLEMLMHQGLKSHAVVSLLSQHGLMEDTAAACRRLLELAVQATYISCESDERERRRRAGRFAAFLWRRVPPDLKKRLPDEVRRMWIGLGKGYGRLVPKNARRWAPDFRTMFQHIDQDDLYVQDYSLLSSMTHGTSDHQVFQFATVPLRMHRDDFVPALLRYSSRYYLALGYAWNRSFEVLADDVIDELAAGLAE